MLERASELAAVRGALNLARVGSGRLIVLEGEAGIGKSTILDDAVAAAPGLGLRALLARGGELEREQPYGIAFELFSPLVRDPTINRDELLAGPAAIAAGLLGLDTAVGQSPSGDPTAAIHGLYWLALNAADQGPLLLAIDDAQWADGASLRFLHYLAQRVGELPIAIIAAFRTGEGVAEAELGRLVRGDRAAIHLAPAPLSVEAVGRLLEALGTRGDDPALREACLAATRGNPFFLTELIWELERAGRDDAGPAVDVKSLVPERVGRFVESRIARLDPEARRLAEAVAILGDAATVRRAARLAGIEPPADVDLLRLLVGASILAPSGTLSLSHPIVRSAVYDALPPVSRRRLHRDAALLLADDGAPIAAVGTHLLEAERTADARVVELLAGAARVAMTQGEPKVAASLLHRAQEEPPAESQEIEIAIELARAEAVAGSPAAVGLFEAALDLATEAQTRATLMLELGRAYQQRADPRLAAQTFKRGLAELGDDADPIAAQFEAGFVASGWMALEERSAAGQIGDRILSRPVFGRAHRELALSLAFQRSVTGAASRPELVEIVHRALREAPIEELISEGQAVELATGVLFATDELPFITSLLTSAIDAAQRAGAFAKIGLYSVARCFPNLLMGKLANAIADADSGIRAAEIGWEAFLPQAMAQRAVAYIERADLESASDILAIDDEPLRQRADWITMPIARGRLFDALGDTQRAVAELRAAAEFGAAVEFRTPGPPEWRRWLSLALMKAGERDEARRVADEALQLGRASGARWPMATALHAAGVAEGGSAGIALLAEACELLTDSPAVLERARVLLELGAAQRRHGTRTAARETLSMAMDLAHRIGALALLERSRSELRALGARPRRYALTGVEALTPAEARVADLAAGGRTNREIAQSLFVTPKNVEYHLANAYRKLGIASRQELGSALDGPAPLPRPGAGP